jgi:hypothetical protein
MRSSAAVADEPISPTDSVIKLLDGDSLNGFDVWISGHGANDPERVFRIDDGLLHVIGNAYQPVEEVGFW